MIEFILLVNKQGQTRLARYYNAVKYGGMGPENRSVLEAELVRQCFARNEDSCSSFLFDELKVIYRRYASLYFILGVRNNSDETRNELALLEFIHCIVEAFDRYFENVCELDIMFGLEKAHALLDEVTCNGSALDSGIPSILSPLHLMDRLS